MMKKSALVLSGGGGLGLAHIGVLKAIENKFQFDYYAGVSAGAIVAAAHALGKTASEISDVIFSQNFLSLAFDFSPSNFGILRGEKVKSVLDEVFGDSTFLDISAQGKTLVIYATDFQNGERVEISTGKISDAIRASISVPVLFEPVRYKEKWLVDGGLTGNFPISETLQKYSGDIIGVDVATSLDTSKDFSQKKFLGKTAGIQNTLERTFRIFFKSQQNFESTDPRLTILLPHLEKFKTIDLGKLKEIEHAGKDCAQKFLSTHP